jgi:hypothetical protein
LEIRLSFIDMQVLTDNSKHYFHFFYFSFFIAVVPFDVHIHILVAYIDLVSKNGLFAFFHVYYISEVYTVIVLTHQSCLYHSA